MPFIGLVLLAILALARPDAVEAKPASQNTTTPCPGVTILNESELTLDGQAICRAAAPYAQGTKPLRVFVYLTDFAPATDQDWYARLDQVQDAVFGVRHLDRGEFDIDAIVFSATTAVPERWGTAIDWGEWMLSTPLGRDSDLGIPIRMRMLERLATGDATAAMAGAISESWSVAFPPPPPTSPPAPPVPTARPLPAAPPAPAPDLSLLWRFLAIIGGAATTVFAWFKGIVPAWARRKRIDALLARIDALDREIVPLITRSDEFLRGDTPDQTLIYRYWHVAGGSSYPEMDKAIRARLQRSISARATAIEIWERLKDTPRSREEQGLTQLIEYYVDLFVVIAGRRPEIWRLSAEERADLFDLASVLNLPANDELVVQSEEILTRIRIEAGEITDLRLEDRHATMNVDGILGNVLEVKDALFKLEQANQNAPRALEAALAARAAAAEGLILPAQMDTGEVFAAVDLLLDQARNAQAKQLWLTVLKKAQEVTEVLPRLIATVKAFIEAQGVYDQLMTIVEQRRTDGYNLDPIAAILGECDADEAHIESLIIEGRLDSAEEQIHELTADIANATRMLDELVALYARSVARLDQLSREVARVESFRTGIVDPAWQRLLGLHESNRDGIGEHYGQAVGILAELFDDPADATDIASIIGSLLNLSVPEGQNVALAAERLDKAFARMNEAEQLFQAIVARDELITTIIETIGAGVAAARTAIDDATQIVKGDDRYVAPEVDALIATAEGEWGIAVAIHNRSTGEYLTAYRAYTRAREIAIQARTSAQAQIDRITGLYTEVRSTRTRAEEARAAAANALREQVDAAREQSTAARFAQLQSILDQTIAREPGAETVQDTELEAYLEALVASYGQLADAFRTVLAQVAADTATHQERVSRVAAAIRAAASSISTAADLVGDDDAGNAGSGALSKARSMVPGTPTLTMSRDTLASMQQQAEAARQYADQAANEARTAIRREEERRARIERERQAALAAQRAAEQAAREARERAERAARDAARRAADSGGSRGSGGGIGGGSRGGGSSPRAGSSRG
jgi:hypothetical protein